MKLIIVTIVCCIGAVAARSIGNRDNDSNPAGLPYNEELVVASSINVRPKGRNEIIRQKRQFGGFGPYGQSQSAANANAYNQQFGPNGFGASAANAQAQGFQSQGPLGGFGANAANAATQNFQAGPGGFGGSAGFSGSQNYNLPGNHNLGISYGQTYSNANGVPSQAGSNSITYT
ncbi:spidroin-2-like [Chironomus tepperi]|uniref:spidroin-2-like n=1 Tax=Chironomus tepperi TaxID=113505 RepID=UPI00391FAA7F